MNFLDPQTKNGKPYGIVRYGEIVKECYLISKHINTSYNDVLKITPSERMLLLQFLVEDAQQEKEAYEKAKLNAKMQN